MIKPTPFYPRQVELNRTMLWENWAGYAAPLQYQYATTVEYFASRNAAALFDTSPLFKYRIHGPEATGFLAGVLTRDIRGCGPGQAQYTLWSDDRGYVLEDGVILHLEAEEYLLTAARPNLRYFRKLAAGMRVEVTDLSEAYGILALQGPHSHDILETLTDRPVTLPYFGVTRSEIAGRPVVLSRTGYTGDLGYELWIRAEEALEVWDALMAKGRDYNLTPMGVTALSMARIDAGLLMIEVDFHSARHSWVDAQRETPLELGFGWMLRALEEDDRSFVGRRAIEREVSEGRTRWTTVGLEVESEPYERLYNEQGLIAPKAGVLVQGTQSLYDRDWTVDPESQWLGYSTSYMFSPILKKHIAIAKVPLELVAPGHRLYMELVVLNRPRYVPVRVTRMPFYNPPRKRAPVPQRSEQS